MAANQLLQALGLNTPESATVKVKDSGLQTNTRSRDDVAVGPFTASNSPGLRLGEHGEFRVPSPNLNADFTPHEFRRSYAQGKSFMSTFFGKQKAELTKTQQLNKINITLEGSQKHV